MSEVGIVAYGAYLPRLRLDRGSIAKANAWTASAPRGKGERTMCFWDEDSITMSVEACRDALGDMDRTTVTGLYLASTSLPFADRQNGAVLAAALNLPSDLLTLDAAGSLRAGTTCLRTALHAAGDGLTLVAGADHRKAQPASVQEMRFGDGAAALVLGKDNVIAKLVASHSYSADFVDHFRGEGEDFDYGWEERWVRDEGYAKIVPAAVSKALEKAGLKVDAISHFVMPCSLPKVADGIAKQLGVPAGAVRDNLEAKVGDTGVAHPLLMLVHALEEAKPGDKIMVVQFGQGADVLIFEATDALKNFKGRVAVSGNLARGRQETDYMKFLSFNDNLKLDWGMRAETDNKTALTVEYRNKDRITGFMGGTCSQCGTVQYPRSRYCVNPNCKAKDTQEPISFADMPAKVMSFTADYLSYSPSPPYFYGQVQFDTGGRVMMGFADTDPGQLEVGTPLKMVFRIKDFDKLRGYRRYFWKAMPADTSSK